VHAGVSSACKSRNGGSSSERDDGVNGTLGNALEGSPVECEKQLSLDMVRVSSATDVSKQNIFSPAAVPPLFCFGSAGLIPTLIWCFQRIFENWGLDGGGLELSGV